MEMNNPSNKDRIAIVAVGYNRKEGLQRLLQSIASADYEDLSVPLVISIDCSGCQDVYQLAKDFQWTHGDKYVNIQETRLGLKEHIFKCFSLTRYFRGVVLLEDDLFVSPYFYHYAKETLKKYEDDNHVAGIAFYSNEFNGFHGIPIRVTKNGFDVFARQAVCSWGEMINERMWRNFSEWLESFDDDFSPFDMNEDIKIWSRAWTKYMYAYMLQSNTYFIYPHESLSTNFNDAGGEHGGGSNMLQISLLQGKRNYQLGDFSLLEHYDVYGDNCKIATWLGLEKEDLSVDFYGSRAKYYGRYVLTPFKLPYKVIKGFSLNMRPWELNIKYGLEGNDVLLYDREENRVCDAPKRKYPYNYVMYFMERYMLRLSPRIVFRYYSHLYWKIIRGLLRL